ncbi:RNA polymerase sigma-70 factor [Adhaeribacter swui]|uniref:RNA polymerase sigma factor n=1 Tax=Adhaeribacter swui TaxID=2086471 RepID=A0A7G7G7R7_9BACT|nr:RNA polymerase sigma-70 factor [Adhaeribacter swui]QNF33201.1 RNA polymerase sigma-70 factor [Adhaeribacter swui]
MQSEPKNYSVEDVYELVKGNEAAFDKLYFCLEPKVYAFALKLVRNKEEAEEVVQEVFLKVWEKRASIQPESGIDSYLFTIAKNLVYNKAKRRVYAHAYHKYLAAKDYAESSTENQIRYNELSQQVKDLIESLPPVRQQVFTLSRLEGFSNQEIAQKLNTSNSNIENHLNKALRLFKTAIAKTLLFQLFLLWGGSEWFK